MLDFINNIKKYVKVEKVSDMPKGTFRSKRVRKSFTAEEREKYLDDFNQMLIELKEFEIEERQK